jgi:hypothetical protein
MTNNGPSSNRMTNPGRHPMPLLRERGGTLFIDK